MNPNPSKKNYTNSNKSSEQSPNKKIMPLRNKNTSIIKHKSTSTSNIFKISSIQKIFRQLSITIKSTRIPISSPARPKMEHQKSISHLLTSLKNSSTPTSTTDLKSSATFDLKIINTISLKQPRPIIKLLPSKSKISHYPSTMPLSSTDPTSSTKM